MKKTLQLTLFLLALPCLFSLSCLNANGDSVDWWVYLKTPHSVYEDSSYFAMYYDSTMNSSAFQFIPERIDQSGNALYNTIMATHSSTYELIVWNDENPLNDRTTSAPSAHSKGIIGLSSSQGFYMQHSLPKYPNIIDNQIDPVIDESELRYGQNFMCLSVSSSTLEAIASQLLIIKAQIYFTQRISSSAFPYPNLQNFGNSQHTNSTPYLYQNISLLSGLNMQMFSKCGYYWDYQIFQNYMVPILNTSLYCETWGRPYQNASCDINSSELFVEEILHLNFSQSGVDWKSTLDHSKWAISSSSYKPWVCFGDLNEMTSQAKRGGSYFCMINQNLWNLLTTAISSTQTCDSNL